MVAIKQRNDPVRIFMRRVGLFLLGLLTLIAVFAVWDVFQKDRESAALRHEAEAQRDDLLLRERKLSQDVTQLKTGRGMEEALREQYDLGKPGEGMVVIVDTDPPKNAQATTTAWSWFHNAFGWWNQ